ncbi:structural maintenance of chromosomes (SMC) family protein [Actinidia rufa]|uniref:Structural maintenance of chromosomes (SMC) family protein n=1 Tax=Actinidia rufa TaxID=165716 RepID=A0A7J0E0D8_9ERIC|nr:structural maintenance of chromosomes (SMC) family protein [Actinidia rufa]
MRLIPRVRAFLPFRTYRQLSGINLWGGPKEMKYFVGVELHSCPIKFHETLILAQPVTVLTLRGQLASVDFTYHVPVKNFDRLKGKSVVVKLIKVKDSSSMTALEVGKGNTEVALSFVGYDEELKSAMEHVFGSAFVCKTIDAVREVSLFLECFFLRDGGDLLRKHHAVAEAETELSIHEKRLSEIEVKLGEHVKRIEQGLLETKSVAKEKQLFYEKCIAEMSMLEKSISEHANNRDGRLKDLEKKIKANKAQVQSASKDLKAQSELNIFRSKMECDTHISCILREQQKLQRKISETNLEWKMENEVRRMEMEHKDCSLKVQKLVEKHAWITSEN